MDLKNEWQLQGEPVPKAKQQIGIKADEGKVKSRKKPPKGSKEDKADEEKSAPADLQKPLMPPSEIEDGGTFVGCTSSEDLYDA